MLETSPLFIGLREGLVRWHSCGIHIGVTRETHGLEDKPCKSQKESLMIERLKVCSHMCEKLWGEKWGTNV